MRLLLALCLALALASPVGADEDVAPLADKWYRLFFEPVTLPTPAGAWSIQVRLCLDDVPGGIAGAPVVGVRILSGVRDKAQLTLSTVGFFPHASVAAGMPYVTVVLTSQSGVPGRYQFKALVQGKE